MRDDAICVLVVFLFLSWLAIWSPLHTKKTNAMTRAANGNLHPSVHRQIAKLMQLHQETHPERIGRRWGVTGEYVRRIWTNLPAEEQAQLEDVLAILGVKNP